MADRSRTAQNGSGAGPQGAEPTRQADRTAQAVDREEPPVLPFTVVGIGASAGGLEALTEFFNAVRSDTGMAFVVVQHLPPQRESLMADILGKHTTMPVRQVEDGLAVEPNHVYVIRPGHTMTLADGRLHLGEPLEKRGHQRPVDDFFRSLAQEQRERAVCVVLSGMGSNGTAGAQMIKAVGGVCVAQDPDSAKFPSMPRSLIDSGLTDYVLRPSEMPETLARYAAHPYAQGGGKFPESVLRRDQKQLTEILALLRTRTRHSFHGYKKPTLVRRVQRRMGLNHLSQLADYVRLLRQTPSEATALADDLMIHVTGFFRDADSWEVLRRTVVVPLVAKRQTHESIRCWVTACSSGEEAYTLAMLLVEEAERAGKQFDIKIFATDMAERSLGHARAGVYPNGIESEITPERLARFFDKDDGVYRVRRDLRELLVFAPQNVLEDPPFSRMDICTCRNLLIYLEPEMQKKLLLLLHFGLTEGGAMMLGSSETTGGVDELFEPIDKKARIFRRVGPTRHGVVEFPLAAGPLSALAAGAGRDSARGRPPGLSLSVAQLTQRALVDLYTPASVVVDRDFRIVYFHGKTETYLDQPQGEPTRELLSLARESIRGAVRTVLNAVVNGEGDRTAGDGTVQATDGVRRILVRAVPLDARPGAGGLFLVSFSQVPDSPMVHVANGDGGPDAAGRTEATLRTELGRVRDDLQTTIEALQASNEELKASNEEVTSINEELQSTNEELETSKEELQSLNEELTTVNAQLQAKMEELLGTTNDLSSLLSSTNIAVVFLDPQFRIRRFTPAVRDLLDLISTDVGRPLKDMARKFADPDLLADAAAVLERLVPIEREVASEAGRWYVRRALPYRTSDNHINGVVLTFVDITERRQAQLELQVSHARVRLAVEAAHMGFWELNVRTGVDVFDAIHARNLGLDPDRRTGTLAEVMAHVLPEDLDPLMAAVQASLASRSELHVQFRVAWADGSVHHISKFGRVVADPGDGGGLRLIGTALDVTDRVANEHARDQMLVREQVARQAAEAANEAKDQFLANVSHELRTPLSAILLWAKVLRNPHAAEPQRREGVDAIGRAAESQRELVEDLLDTSRIDAGKLRLDVRAFDLGVVVREAAEGLRPAAEARRVTVSVDTADDLGVVNADPDRLRQVLWNLLSNAVKFTPPDGHVGVAARRDGAGVEITVTDTGRGMAASLLPHVFERFWQAKSADRYAKAGLGLGLSIARQLVELHGGTLDAASDGEGQGATFRARLPLPPQETPPRAAVRPAGGSEARLAGVDLLLVEDDVATREALVVVLTATGAAVTAVGTVADAWSAYEARRPDVILSDIGLPDGDGYDLIRRVRTHEADRKAATTPAVALTALVRRRSVESGFQQHLPKPVDSDHLVRSLAGLLER